MDALKPVDIVISFDTTGSMYPCITQVRRSTKQMIERLFSEIPDLRLGLVAHGDYVDLINYGYTIKTVELTDDKAKLTHFIDTVGSTGGGGNGGEAYELVLHDTRSFKWRAGAKKVLVLIGDEVPHKPGKHGNSGLDWRNELELLKEAGVVVYGVQALSNPGYRVDDFYEELARRTSGFKLNLDQLSHVTELIFAVAYKQLGDTQLQAFEQDVVKRGKMDRSMDKMFNALFGRVNVAGNSIRFSNTSNLKPVPPSRFQVMEVDNDAVIADFVQSNGVTFRAGRGFYELTKPVKVQSYKEIVLRDKTTGDMYSGDAARDMVGLPRNQDAKLKPVDLQNFDVFVQSTSYNRKLLGGTKFLYEVESFSQ